MSTPKVTVKVQKITKPMARSWLEKNTNNRALSGAKVSILAGDMDRGEFTVSPDAIGFNGQGLLINGQHRLAALIQSEADHIFALVGRGFPSDARVVADQGKKRSLRDVIKVNDGIEIKSKWGDIALGMVPARVIASMTMPQRRRFFLEHSKAVAWTEAALAGAGSRIPKSTRSVIARAYYSAPKARLMEFCRILATGEFKGDPGDTAAIRLRDFLAFETIGGRGKVRPTEVYIKSEVALFNFLAGNSMERLMMPNKLVEEMFLLPGESVDDATAQRRRPYIGRKAY